MDTLLLDEPRLSADRLAALLAARGKNAGGVRQRQWRRRRKHEVMHRVGPDRLAASVRRVASAQRLLA